LTFRMAKKDSWKDKYALDTRKEYSYRGTGRSAGGERIYRNSTVSDLMWLVNSAKRGFESEVQIRPGQAKKFSDLVKRAEAAGGKVTVVPKGQKREFDVKSTGSALFRGGPRVGSAAATSFFEAGGKVKGTGVKAQGSLPKNVLASKFGIMKLGMKTDNPSFKKRKKKFGQE
jgi:hypothetical protein